MKYKYVGINITKKTKRSLVVHSVLVKDNEGMTCSTLAAIDLFFADAWRDLQRQTGLVKEFRDCDAIGQLLLNN